jgi:broad specificity polyphosphatase/5'/3'-nucleotidase SurE
MTEAFSKFADTVVVVPSTERSGSTNTVTWAFWNKRVLEVELVSKRPTAPERRALTVYAVDGYPADCVLVALVALLGGSPPDLLVFGAARVAAALRVPPIAVSDVGARPAVFFH